MDGQISFNQTLNSLFYQVSDITWSALDNKLTVFVSVYLTETDTTPLVQRSYFVPLEGNASFAGLKETINQLIKPLVEADGLFLLQPFSQ